jgi:hypothetical protein
MNDTSPLRTRRKMATLKEAQMPAQAGMAGRDEEALAHLAR